MSKVFCFRLFIIHDNQCKTKQRHHSAKVYVTPLCHFPWVTLASVYLYYWQNTAHCFLLFFFYSITDALFSPFCSFSLIPFPPYTPSPSKRLTHALYFTIIAPSSILLLAEGRTAYMGSTADALPYFERCSSFLTLLYFFFV